VLADGLLGDEELGRDGRVRATLGHATEHLALAGGEDGERLAAGQQLGDDLGVHRGAAVGHPAHRVDELADVGDPVLEQVADAPVAVGQQLARVQRLDVLGEHQDRHARHLGAGRDRRLQTLIGEGGRQPHVDHRDVRPVLDQCRQQRRPIVDRFDDLEVERLEQACQPVPEEGEVFGDDNAHGSSMVTTVGPPGGLDSVIVPSKAARRRSIPRRPVPESGSAPPIPSSPTIMNSTSPECRMLIQALCA
jgi:hypothetical protein